MARELILINPDVTLLQALQTMIRAKSHMIFVKGGDGKIAGLLTLEDITGGCRSARLKKASFLLFRGKSGGALRLKYL